jgi:hypothetical protein
MEFTRVWTSSVLPGRRYLLNGEPVEVETSITVNFTFGAA